MENLKDSAPIESFRFSILTHTLAQLSATVRPRLVAQRKQASAEVGT
jgi:hypothetical protein